MAMLGIVAVGVNPAPVCAETPGGLLQSSLAKLRAPELKIAYALHPDICTIGWPKDQNWTIEWACRRTSIGRSPFAIRALPRRADRVHPRTPTAGAFFWSVDASGEPEDLFGDRHHPFNSIQDDCPPKGTLAADRAEMDKRGIAVLPEEILDYAGTYTGKPRPIK